MDVMGKIFLSTALVEKIGLPLQPFINVRVGNIVVKSQLVVNLDHHCRYMLSPSLSKALYIKKRKPLQLRYDREKNYIHLGPTIGIFSTFLPGRGEFEPTSTHAELIYLSKVGKTFNAQIYVFTPAGINWSNNTVKGYAYREGGVWVPAVYALPDVVYDRVTSRRSEIQLEEVKKQLMSLPYLKYFNPYFLNKWMVHQILMSNPALHKHIPETLPLTSDNLAEMLGKYPVLYLKPCNGSLGKGIIRLKNNQDVINYTIFRKGRSRGQVDSAEQLLRKTQKFRGDRPYIVQQGLNLATYRGASFDVRIMYQKNRNGQWQIGKKFVRVAPKGSHISNLSSGGRPETVKKIFRYLYRNKELIERKNEEIAALCNTVAQTMENETGDIFGELGLDIGLDLSGTPQIIEVNSKPRKTTESERSNSIMRNAIKRPLEFAAYLAGF